MVGYCQSLEWEGLGGERGMGEHGDIGRASCRRRGKGRRGRRKRKGKRKRRKRRRRRLTFINILQLELQPDELQNLVSSKSLSHCVIRG